MNLYAKITTSTGKIVSKADNKSIKIEVLDIMQNIIFSKTFTVDHINTSTAKDNTTTIKK